MLASFMAGFIQYAMLRPEHWGRTMRNFMFCLGRVGLDSDQRSHSRGTAQQMFGQGTSWPQGLYSSQTQRQRPFDLSFSEPGQIAAGLEAMNIFFCPDAVQNSAQAGLLRAHALRLEGPVKDGQDHLWWKLH